MKDCVKWAIEALIKADDSMGAKEKAKWIAGLHGESPAPLRPKVIRFREACALTGLSRTTLQALADRGELERVYTSASRERCAGVTVDSLDKWLARFARASEAPQAGKR